MFFGFFTVMIVHISHRSVSFMCVEYYKFIMWLGYRYSLIKAPPGGGGGICIKTIKEHDYNK